MDSDTGTPPARPRVEPQRRVVVVGAGIAGLSAALSLAEAGLAPLVLEADPEFCGGRFGSRPGTAFSYGGIDWSFPGEHGIHGLWWHYRNLRALLARHGVAPALAPAYRQEWVYSKGRRVQRAEVGRRLRRSLIPAPFHYLALLANPRFLAMLSPLDLLRIPWVGMTMLTMLALDPMREGERLAGLTVKDFLPGWPAMLRAFAGALARSGLSTGAGDVPLAGFIALFRFYSLLRRDASGYEYLRADPEREIVGPLLARLEALGGTLVKGARVARLERLEADGWLVHWQASGQGIPAAATPAQQVVLATDAPGARRIVEAGDTASAAEDLRWPEGRGTAAVRVWFKTAPKLAAEAGMFGGDFILDNFFWLHVLQDDFIDWHRGTGGSAVEAHIYGPSSLLEEPDAALLALAVRDLVRTYPSLRGEMVHAIVLRNPPTHTLFSIGSTARHLGVRTPWRGLYCCGDWVRHDSPALFLERACLTGLEAANLVRAAYGLSLLPILPHAGPELLASGVERVARASRGALAGVYGALSRMR